jgi:hypothetical protein
LVAGCWRWVKAGKVVSGEHLRTEVGRAIATEVKELTRELGRIAAVIEAGGGRREAGEPAMDAVRALQVTLYREPRDEEVDALRQAQAVTQVVGMSVRAAREREAVKNAGEREDLRQAVGLLEWRPTCWSVGWPIRVT